MPHIEFDGQSYLLAEGESVLDALLRNGIKASHSCKAGVCGSCLMRATAGNVPQRAQAGLKDSWKSQGYFLACVAKPESDLSVTELASEAMLGATIVGLQTLSADVLGVRLRCDMRMDFRAGQYVTLVREGGLARSYSIASLPEDGDLELHVRKVPDGLMSGWLHESAKCGDRLSVLGPSGECFYVPGNQDQPLLLVGTGTGLAPLYGIVRDALKNGHRGPIHLFHGALHAAGLYLVEELRRLALQHPHFQYTPAVLNGEDTEGITVGALDRVVLGRFPKLTGWRSYICGDPGIVNMLKKKFFLSGVASRDIYADAFLPSAR